MIISYIWRYIFVLLLPVLRGLLNYGHDGSLSHLVMGELIFSLIIITIAVIKWKRCRIIVCENSLSIRTGLFLTRCSVVPISNIASVIFEKGLFLSALRAVSLRIDTEGGSARSADFKIIVSKYSATQIEEKINFSDKPLLEFRSKPLRLVIMAAASASSAAGLLIAAPVIDKAGKLLGENLSGRLVGTITTVAALLERLIPPAASIISVVMVVGFGVSFLLTLFKNAPFRLYKWNDRLMISHGMLSHEKTCFTTDAINAVIFNQSPLMRVLGQISVSVCVAGYGKLKGENAVIIPAVSARRLDPLIEKLLPECEKRFIKIKPPKRAFQRVIFLPIVELAAIPVVTVFACGRFPVVASLIIFVAAILEIILAYGLSVRIKCYRLGGIGLSDGVQACSLKRFSLLEIRAANGRTEIICITRSPFDKLVKLCSVRVTLRSEQALSVNVNNLDYDEVLRTLKHEYQI